MIIGRFYEKWKICFQPVTVYQIWIRQPITIHTEIPYNEQDKKAKKNKKNVMNARDEFY